MRRSRKSLPGLTRALWAAVAGGGDMDTNCAIVGGIVALAAGAESIAAQWLASREPLRFD